MIAFATRSEKDKKVHAPKDIAVIIYISTLFVFVLLLASIMLEGSLIISKGIDGSISFAATTTILVAIFVPKVIAYSYNYGNI